jgi:hypothetical protein
VNNALLLLGAAVLAGCAPPRSRPPPEGPESARPAAVPSAAALPGAPPTAPAPPWILAEQLRTLHPEGKPAPSQHLDGGFTGAVLADDLARGYAASGHRVPPGGTVVEALSAPAGAQASVYLVMVKRPPGFDPAGEDWEYLVIDPGGAIEQRGILPLCARCHAEAPRDRLFGSGR